MSDLFRPIAHPSTCVGLAPSYRASPHCGLALDDGGVWAVHRRTSISLRPFAPRALPRFIATMDALTPVRPVLRILIRDIERRPCFRTGLSVSCVWPSDPSVSKHLARPRDRFRTQPLSVASSPLARVWASPLASRLAARPGRIEFVILRTSRSPPVALHPASRRRSYFRLQAGVRIPEKDLHLSDQTHLQTH
jgi:hypothetical protein